MNTPIKDQGKKFLLFLYHAPTQERVGEHSKPAGAASAGASLKDKRLKDAERSKEAERKEAKGSKNSSDLLDLNDRVHCLPTLLSFMDVTNNGAFVVAWPGGDGAVCV
jgi:hypothetical protein